MTRAFRCDGCGEYQDGACSMKLTDHQEANERQRYDLCETCNRTVLRWLDGHTVLEGDG